MLIIGIAGGTGSGKTTVVNQIVKQLPTDEVCVISQDSYYKATDNLSFEDADQLLSGSAFVEPGFDGDGSDIIRPLAAVIDLRNHDEIQKGQRNRTDGSIYFYQQLYEGQQQTRIINDDDSTQPTRWIHIPILNDVNSFWDKAIDRMPTSERIKATLQTAFSGGGSFSRLSGCTRSSQHNACRLGCAWHERRHHRFR